MKATRAKYTLVLLYSLALLVFLNSCKKKETDEECPNCPSVISISPTQAYGYDILTITGTNFSSDLQSNIVKINGVQVNPDSILSGSETQLIVKVPKRCGSGSVTVDLDAELTNFGSPPQFNYLFRYTAIDIGGTGLSVMPCASGSSSCPSSGFQRSMGIVLDQNENVFFSDAGLHQIFQLEKNSSYDPCLVAGCGQGSTNGSGTQASMDSPSFIAINSDGTMFVPENGTAIRTVTSFGTVAPWYSNNDLNMAGGAIAFLQNNSEIAYVTNPSSHSIWKINHSGGIFSHTQFAGSLNDSGYADGPDTTASFYSPTGIVVDNIGNVFVSDTKNNLIRKISPAGVVSTLAGSTLPGSSNGQGNLASFNRPLGLFIDRNNNIYVADHENSSIRKLTPSGFVSTVYQFTLGMNSPKPNGITQDSEGNFYVTFTSGNSGVKKIIVE